MSARLDWSLVRPPKQTIMMRESLSSDSAALDAVFEVLVHAGRSAPMAKTMLAPEAWSKTASAMPQTWRDMYAYSNSVMEPWDGPAALAMTDGRWVVAGVDRNALRPLRYTLTGDNLLIVGSETGMCPLESETVLHRGRVGPGGMIAVDLHTGEFFNHREVIDALSQQHPYAEWLENVVDLDEKIGKGPEDGLGPHDEMDIKIFLYL